MPVPKFDDVMARGRLVAQANDTDRSTGTSVTDDSITGRLLRGAQLATSGNEFIKATTGLDSNKLPGYLSKPIDILASPVSLAMLAAAPFTGGVSLTGVGAGGRLAAVGTEMLVGGLAGGFAAQQVAERLPENTPNWLKIGAPLAAGVLVGGGSQAAVARRLPGALKAAQRVSAPGEVASGNYGLGVASPLELTEVVPGKTKTQQVLDYVKTITKLGTPSDERFSGIIGQTAKLSRTVQDERQVVLQIVKSDLGRDDIQYIKDAKTGGAAHYINVAEKPSAVVTSSAAAPIADAAGALDDELRAALAAYAATPTDDTLNAVIGIIDRSPAMADEALTNIRAQIKGGEAGKALAMDDTIAGMDEALAATAGEAPIAPAAGFLDDIETKFLPYAKQAAKAAPEPTKLASAIPEGAAARIVAKAKAVEEELASVPGADPSRGITEKLVNNEVERYAYDMDGNPILLGKGQIVAPNPATQTAPSRNWRPLADVAAHPSRYDLTPDQLDLIKRNAITADDYWKMYGAVKGEELGRASDIDPDGFFLPRGRPVEDGTEAIVQATGRPRNLAAIPGQAKERIYKSVQEGVDNGEVYPPLEEAMADYVAGVGNAAIGRHALNQLEKLVDDEGKPLLLNLSRAMPLRDEAGEIIRDATGKPVVQNYTQAMPRGYEGLTGAPGSAAPAELARAFNAQMNPQGVMAQASRLSEVFNKPLRTLHVAFDMGDFIARIGPTAAILHPVVFAKATAKGFGAVFNTRVVGQEFKAINAEMAAAGMNITVRDMAKFGLRFNQTDFAPGGLAKLPGISHLGGVYGNALDIMRARMMQAEILNKGAAGLDINNPQILQQISAGINLTTGAAVGRPVDNANLLTQFPNWLQSQIELLITAASKGGLEGAYARKSMVGLVGLGVSAAVIGNGIQGKLDETVSKDNWVPTLHIGDQKINVFGPYASLFKGVVAAAKGDPEALIRGRAAPMLQVGWDLITGSTFAGQPANFNDAAYWVKASLPYTLSSLTQQPNASGALQAIGVNARTETPRQKIEKEAEEMFGKSYADFTGKERLQLKQANPTLFAEVQQRLETRAATGDRVAMGTLETQKVNDELIARQRELFNLMQAGQLSPKAMREAIGDSTKASAIEKQRIRKDFGMSDAFTDSTDAQKALTAYYNLFDTADLGVLNGGPKTGQMNWDEFDRQNTALMASLTPDQQKVITDRITVHAPELQWFYNNKNLIDQSGYFDTSGLAFDKFEKSVKRVAPDADTLTDLYNKQNEAALKGDRPLYAITSTLINQINALSEGYKKQMRAKDKALMQALIQNGYISQPKTQLVAQQYQ